MKNQIYSVVEFNPMSDWFLSVAYKTLEEAQKAYEEKHPDLFETITLYCGDESVMCKEGRRV